MFALLSHCAVHLDFATFLFLASVGVGGKECVGKASLGGLSSGLGEQAQGVDSTLPGDTLKMTWDAGVRRWRPSRPFTCLTPSIAWSSGFQQQRSSA